MLAYVLDCRNDFTHAHHVPITVEGSRPYIQVQNKFTENYDAASKMRSLDAYSVAITAWTGVSHQHSNLAFSNLTIPISHDGPGNQRLLLDSGIVTLAPKTRFPLTTNVNGKILFGVLLDGQLHKPLFRAHPPFADKDKSVVFPVDSHAIHELTRVSGSSLKDGGLLDDSVSEKSANAAAIAIQNLLLPALHGDFHDQDASGQSSRLQKRSLEYQSKFSEEAPYNPESNIVTTRLSRKPDSVFLRTLALDHMPNAHWEVRFDEEATFIPHSRESLFRLQKRHFVRRLYRRGGPFEKWGSKLKEFGGSALNLTKSVFVELPRAIFNRTAYKSGPDEVGKHVGDAVFNLTRNSVDLAHDAVNLLPYGEKINDKIGLTALTERVANSRSIMVSHTPNGMQVTTVDSQNRVYQHIITSVQHVFAAIQGIFQKIKIGFQKLVAFLKSCFEWNGILMNHRILSAHLMKMMPFIKDEVTSR